MEAICYLEPLACAVAVELLIVARRRRQHFSSLFNASLFHTSRNGRLRCLKNLYSSLPPAVYALAPQPSSNLMQPNVRPPWWSELNRSGYDSKSGFKFRDKTNAREISTRWVRPLPRSSDSVPQSFGGMGPPPIFPAMPRPSRLPGGLFEKTSDGAARRGRAVHQEMLELSCVE